MVEEEQLAKSREREKVREIENINTPRVSIKDVRSALPLNE